MFEINICIMYLICFLHDFGFNFASCMKILGTVACSKAFWVFKIFKQSIRKFSKLFEGLWQNLFNVGTLIYILHLSDPYF